MGWGQRGEWRTEEGLQADHTSNEAIKADAEFAACVQRGDGLLYLVTERETCGQRGLGHRWSGGLGTASNSTQGADLAGVRPDSASSERHRKGLIIQFEIVPKGLASSLVLD